MDSLNNERKDRILSFMRDQAYRPLKYEELLVVLDVRSEDYSQLQQLLDNMVDEALIIKTRKERFAVPERMGLITGKFQGNAKGFGFVIPDIDQDDVFIPPNEINGAMNGDRVMARLNRKSARDRHQEGEIFRVLERANKTIVGVFETSDHFGFVTPDHIRLSGDIVIPKDLINGAKQGQKVVVEITKWPGKNRNAEGRITEILGYEGEQGVDILSIIRTYNIPYEFPQNVIDEANAMPAMVLEEDTRNRRDLRDLKMITIDGEDAKDLDDAVSIEILPNKTFRLGVHIADVTHYVREGSSIDGEAYLRGTSVYFPDRVIPMLPKELSNHICSLNANQDRLAFSVMMNIDHKGNVIDHDIFESIINVNERMNYTDVYRILQEEDEELKDRYNNFVEDFENMRTLSLILREKRMQRGSVDFDFDEAKILIDEKGKITDIVRYKMTIANKIIEEFMLLCNEVVSEHFYWIGIPFVYRVHEDPDPDKMESLSQILATFGYRLKGYQDVHPKAIQEVLGQIKGKPEEKAISMTILRSMQKARYSDIHAWHFGLASEYYSHFTAPIRRYPDLIIHRIMKEQIGGRLDDKRIDHYKQILHNITIQCSERERAAQDAERDCEDMKKAEFMKDKVGQHFDAVISSITGFGLFAELDNTVEGLVRLSSLDDDYYVYNESALCLIGERTKKIYRIGDRIKVQLIKSSVETRQIDFVIIDENGNGPKTGNRDVRDIKNNSNKNNSSKNNSSKDNSNKNNNNKENNNNKNKNKNKSKNDIEKKKILKHIGAKSKRKKRQR